MKMIFKRLPQMVLLISASFLFLTSCCCATIIPVNSDSIFDSSLGDDDRKVQTLYDSRYLQLGALSREQIDFLNNNIHTLISHAQSSDLKTALPDVEVLLYMLIMASNSIYGGFDFDHITSTESMFFHHPDSDYSKNRIQTPYGNWMMNGYDIVDDSATDSEDHWINYYVHQSSSKVYELDFDGLFIDSASHKLSDYWLNGLDLDSLTESYDDSSWKTARYESIELVKSKLTNKIVVFNGLHSGNGAEDSLAVADGAMFETFGYLSTGYKGESNWISDLALIEENKDGEDILLVSKLSSDNRQARTFLYASYLLIADPSVTYANHNITMEEASPTITIWPEFSINIGAPTGSYQNSGGLYIREFENGIVIVNPSASTSRQYRFSNTVYSLKSWGDYTIDSDGLIRNGGLTQTEISGNTTLSPVSALIIKYTSSI